MKELISKQLKKDLGKLKSLKDRIINPNKKDVKNVGKVIPPAEEPLSEKDVHEKTEEEQEQLQAGYIIKYAKGLDYEVVDEEGKRITCNNIAEAEILSRLIELKLFFMERLEK